MSIQYVRKLPTVEEILASKRKSEAIDKVVKGVMVESYLVEGNQSAEAKDKMYGKSITDGCIGWDETEKLIYKIAESI